jgi:hypothetical protein
MSDESLPPRPRRRLLTPVTGALAALVLAGAGFIGGVQVQKGEQDSGSAGGGARAGVPGGFPGAAAQGQRAQTRGGQGGQGRQAPGGANAGGGAAPTTGEVTSKRGSTLYVEGTDGTTIKVRTDDDSKVTRTAATSARGVYPGDTVIVQGETAKSGTVTAAQIVATSSTASGGLAGLFGGMGGGPPTVATPPTGG